MIFVHDKGRMANNMLQYGHVYAWGREHGCQTVSIRFAYKYPWFHICHTPHHNFLTYVFAKYAAKWGLIPTVSFDEEDADYSREEQLMLSRRMILVEGWYARWYDLFLKYKPEILQLFAFDEAVEQKAKERLGDMWGVRLGVHIRRGDYATFQGGRFFYSDEQYVRIIRDYYDHCYPKERLNVYICSNDPNLDKDYYREQLSNFFVYFPEGNPAEDLCLLSKCDNLMGPPSTFTLVASMYQNQPLYWIEDPDKAVMPSDFKYFDDLFRHII
jgi:hypothetical protein